MELIRFPPGMTVEIDPIIVEPKPKFNPEFLEAQFDAVIAYMEAHECDEYTTKNHLGFRISFRRVQK